MRAYGADLAAPTKAGCERMSPHAEEQLREEVAHLRKLLQEERRIAAKLLEQVGHLKGERDSLREAVERLKAGDPEATADDWEEFS